MEPGYILVSVWWRIYLVHQNDSWKLKPDGLCDGVGMVSAALADSPFWPLPCIHLEGFWGGGLFTVLISHCLGSLCLTLYKSGVSKGQHQRYDSMGHTKGMGRQPCSGTSLQSTRVILGHLQ